MISRKKYFGIILMMGLLFVIFMFSVIVNEEGSFFDINEYVREDRPSGEGRWSETGEEDLILYIGGQNKELGNVVSQWCLYTKRALVQAEQLDEYEEMQEERLPSMVLLDGEHLELTSDCRELDAFIEKGIPLVFLTVPDSSQILASARLQDILGIDYMVQRSVNIQGIQLFDGFFLGGTATYLAETEEEEERQDMVLSLPWYILQGGTKTYMVGLMDTKEVMLYLDLEKEDGATSYFPGIIWRNSCDASKVFAVCGDYMSSMAGLGILNSFCYEMQTYDIYPVVNAQSVLVHNFPNLSGENAAKLMAVYSRSPQMFFQGIMWPSVSAMAEINNYKLTCFINPQYDYLDSARPKAEELPFYLQQLRQLNSEAGMAVSYAKDSNFEIMLEDDTKFYESLKSNYRYQTLYTEEKDLASVLEQLDKNSILKKVVTVGTEYNSTEDLFGYITDDVTLQRITGNAKEHTYMDDFIARGIESALLYSNVLVDLNNAVWPQNAEDEWQNLYDEMASNVRTYWSAFRDYDKTTLSESDFRIRNLLNLDYSENRQGDTIILDVEQVTKESYFILRTHEEKIVGIRGGKFEKLETDVYLITATDTVVEIDLEQISLKEQKKR